MNGSQVAEADSDRHAQSRDAGVGSGRTYPGQSSEVPRAGFLRGLKENS